jgi:hypothetical protein
MANIKVGVIDNDCMSKVAGVCTSDEFCAFFVASATSFAYRAGRWSAKVLGVLAEFHE